MEVISAFVLRVEPFGCGHQVWLLYVEPFVICIKAGVIADLFRRAVVPAEHIR